MSVVLLAGALAGISASLPVSRAQAQTAGGDAALQISWEVRNRFRFLPDRDYTLSADGYLRLAVTVNVSSGDANVV